MMKISHKTNNYLLFTGVFLFVLVISLSNCTSDQLPEPTMANCEITIPTYSLEIQPIIEVTCAYSGCHLDVPPGLFGTYDGLLPYLEDNTFRQRVIIQRADATTGMPPDYATEGPTNLTAEQLNIIECWLDAGHPE